MWKKHKLVMLPTNEKSKLVLSFKEKNFNQLVEPRITLIEESNYKLSNIQSQHLYILSDEEIKEGDWCINPITKSPFQVKVIERNRLVYPENSKKIITTTDNSLKTTEDLGEISRENILHQIPQSFIEYFVSEYNKGNVITEVMIEYEKIITDTKHYMLTHECKGFDEKLKINPNNTINIKPVKDS